MSILRLPCVGHTLNLAVQKAIQVRQVATAIGRCRKIVANFHRSRIDSEELEKKQDMFQDIKKHKLIMDVSTRWNSTYDMLERMCEQQLAVSAVLLHRRDLVLLEISATEWRILEDIIQLLRPFKMATQHLSGEKYPTISAVGPLLAEIRKRVTINNSDCRTIKEFKQILSDDMDSRYRHPDIKQLLNKSSFLDPRFKSLIHLSALQREEISDMILTDLSDLTDLVSSSNDSQEVQIDSTHTNGPTQKKLKINALSDMLGESFTVNSTTTESNEDVMKSELLRYKSEATISLEGHPLQWWRNHVFVYPNLSKLACKYLCVTATSVPSEQLFCTAGNIVTNKRASLLPENVNKLVFLYSNLPELKLDYKRVNDNDDDDDV